VSFISEQAWKDIYAPRSKVIVKDPDFYGAVNQGPNGAKSLFNASTEQHPVVRKQLSYAFSEKSLRDQEPLMKQYTDLLIQRLRDFAESGAPTDLVSWFKFTIFDMMGDLSIGKPFNCLRDGKYHSWVSAIYASIKIGPYLRVASTYTTLKRLLPLIVPTHLREARARHEKYIKENTMDRISMGVMEERRDFLSYILANRGEGGLTDDEVVANSSLLILAGSDSTASALSGIFYHLLKNPTILQRVTDEIRAAFAAEDDISFVTAGTRLSYTYAVIDEGLRLYPPGPTLAPRRTPHGGLTKIDDQWIPPWVGILTFCSYTP
jgi:cytochrome P450